MKKITTKKIALIVVIFLFIGAGTIFASGKTDFQEEEVFLSENEMIDGDYLGAAGVVDVAGTVDGDVMIAGGMINFSGQTLNFSGLDLDTYVLIGSNNISINSTALPELNASAILDDKKLVCLSICSTLLLSS